MAAPSIKIKVPATAKKGEVVEIKTTVGHDMESGQRKDKEGKAIPRKIINTFTATFNGKEVMRADWHPAVSANPYLSFFLRVEDAGTLEMSWTDDDGSVYKQTAEIKLA